MQKTKERETDPTDCMTEGFESYGYLQKKERQRVCRGNEDFVEKDCLFANG